MADTSDRDFVDQEIVCANPNCKKPFIFEAGEQKFFAEKGFIPPKRCKPCRIQRKEARPDRAPAERSEAASTEYADVWADDSPRPSRARKRSKGSKPHGDR